MAPRSSHAAGCWACKPSWHQQLQYLVLRSGCRCALDDAPPCLPPGLLSLCICPSVPSPSHVPSPVPPAAPHSQVDYEDAIICKQRHLRLSAGWQRFCNEQRLAVGEPRAALPILAVSGQPRALLRMRSRSRHSSVHVVPGTDAGCASMHAAAACWCLPGPVRLAGSLSSCAGATSLAVPAGTAAGTCPLPVTFFTLAAMAHRAHQSCCTPAMPHTSHAAHQSCRTPVMPHTSHAAHQSCCTCWQHADSQVVPGAAAGDVLTFERRSASRVVLHVSVTRGADAGKARGAHKRAGRSGPSDSDSE
jgi:hypothetical protein